MGFIEDDNVQQKLTRVRPPRVRITYDVETGGAQRATQLPFIVGIFANLSGDAGSADLPIPYKQREFIEIDRDNIYDIMKAAGASVDLSKVALPATSPGGALEHDPTKLTFGTLDDFKPMSVVGKVGRLAAQNAARSNVRMLQARAEIDDALAAVLDRTCAPDQVPLRKAIADKYKTAQTSGAGAGAAGANGGTNGGASGGAAGTNGGANGGASGTNGGASGGTSGANGGGNANTNANATPSPSDAWRTLAVTPAASTALVAPDQLTPDNVLAQLLGHLVTTQPQAAPASGGGAQNAANGASGTNGAPATGAGTQGTTPPAATGGGAEPAGAAGAAGTEGAAGAAGAGAAGAGAAGDKTQAATPPAADGGAAQNGAPAGPNNPQGGNAQGGAAAAPAAAPTPPDWGDALALLGYYNDVVLSAVDVPPPQGQPVPVRHAAQWIDTAVVQIDARLSANIDAILHADSFQRLEATWRSIANLVANTETGTMLKLKVFNTRRDELSNDLETAVEFDQSLMFKLTYEAEYGTLGGNPFSVLVMDYPIGKSALDIEFLNKVTQVAAAAHAPLIAGADPSMFGLDDYSQLGKPRDLAKIFEGTDWISFNEFRQTEDSRYATLVLPRLLLRLPYDYTVAPVGFNYIEDISSDGTRPSTDPNNVDADQNGVKFADIDKDSNFLWGNAAFALAQRITNAFALYQWTAAIRGEEGGGLVDGLPLYQYRTDRGSQVLFCPTEVAITDRREKELSDLGFIALCHSKGSSNAVFFGGQTVNQPITYLSDEANANAQLSARLPYMLAASRFAHYVKVLVRRKVGGFQNRATLEGYLNTWIAQYVLLDDNATQEIKASYPLRSASIVVTEVPGAPGSYKATMFLKPHFQLEELTTSIRLVADLPKAG